MSTNNKDITFSDCPDFKFAVNALYTFREEAEQKFTKGQIEHGGSILTKPILPEIYGEVVDQMFYVSALCKKRDDIAKELLSVIDEHYTNSVPLLQILNKIKNL